MAIMLRCPHCLSCKLKQHVTEKQKTEKFKCLSCGKIVLITRVEYEEVHDVD